MVYALVFLARPVTAFDNPARQTLRHRYRRPRPARQRGLAQQRDRPHRADRRPGVRRRPDRAVRRRALLRLNALSFVAMFVALRGMDPPRCTRAGAPATHAAQIREARCARRPRRRALRMPLR